MKNVIKVFGVISLMIFSFYYTEKVALYVSNNTPLKKEIYTFKEKNENKPINATIISKSEIIPGISSLEVDVNKSYEQMKNDNIFDINKIVYKKQKPDVSIYNNKDKIIVSGNMYKNAVSLVINRGENLFLDKLNIKYDYIDSSKYCINRTRDCKKLFKIKTSLIITNSNFLSKIESIKAGDFIYIQDNLSDRYINILIKKLEFLNLKILSLDEHILE